MAGSYRLFKSTIFLGILSLLVLYLVTGIAMAAPIPGGTFGGTVTLDGNPAADESFFVNCTNGQNATLFNDGSGMYQLSITIPDGGSTTGDITACIPGIGAITYTGVDLMVDNLTMNFAFTTPPAIISLSSATYTVDEDVGVGYLAITIVRSGYTASTVYASFTTMDGTAVSGGVAGNYTAGSSQWVFAAGQTERYAAVTITNDTFYGGSSSKYFFVNLTTTNATFGTPRNATVTILEDEEPPLVANFTSELTYSYGYRNLNFTSTSTGNILGYNWSFDDGTANETTQDSYRFFVTNGTYTVILTVTNGTANSTHSENITIISPPPVASFMVNVTSGLAPLCVEFYNFSYGNITAYAWDFGDGSANVTEASPIHTFNNSSTYLVILTVSNSTMSSSDTITITVTSPATGSTNPFASVTNSNINIMISVFGLILVMTIIIPVMLVISFMVTGEANLELVVIGTIAVGLVAIVVVLMASIAGLIPTYFGW
jgi:PKD repeat protein